MWDTAETGWVRRAFVAILCACLAVLFAAVDTGAQAVVVNGPVGVDGGGGNGGFTVPQVDEDFTIALGDFERYSGKSEWEKAFRALSDMREADAGMLCRTKDGLIVPVRRRIWDAVVTLPAEGRQAFDVFYGGQASALAQQMNAPANRGTGGDVTAAHELFIQYFISRHGVSAADLLGDNAYEQGWFADAATYWRAILEHHDLDDAAGARIGVKLAFALAGSGRADAFEKQRQDLLRRFSDQSVVLGGRSVEVPDALAMIGKPVAEPVSVRGGPVVDPVAEVPADGADPLWRVQFMSDASQRSLASALQNWWGPASGLSGLVPAYDTDEERIYCNWLGVCFAIDAQTGKLLWRSGKFSELNGKFSQFQHGSAIATRYEIAVAGDNLVALTLPLDRLNHWREPYALTVMNPRTGAIKWQTGSLGWVGQMYSFVGRPLVDGEQIITVSHPREGAEATLHALSIENGEQLWTVPLGQAVMTNTPRGQQYIPDPTLMRDGDQLYVLTNNGALLNVDVPRRRIAWAFAFKPPPGTGNQENYFYGNGPSDMGRLHTRGVIRKYDGVLYFKETSSPTLYALDPAQKKLIWKRPVNADATIVAMDDDRLFLLGEEMLALDRRTRGLRWATKLPIGAGRLRVVQDGDSVLVLTGRGIYEVDKSNGDVLRIFRGHDMGSQGGSVFTHHGKLLCISNHTLCAYAPVVPGEAGDGVGETGTPVGP